MKVHLWAVSLQSDRKCLGFLEASYNSPEKSYIKDASDVENAQIAISERCITKSSLILLKIHLLGTVHRHF